MQTELTKKEKPSHAHWSTSLSARLELSHLSCLLWLMDVHFGHRELASGHVLSKQTSNVERFIRWKSRRKCRKVSNHCECDASSDEHAIYLLPINGQTPEATTTTTTTATIGATAHQLVENVRKRVEQSIKAAMKWAEGRIGQIGRFIKRDGGWQIMSLTMRAQDDRTAGQQSTMTQGHWNKVTPRLLTCSPAQSPDVGAAQKRSK